MKKIFVKSKLSSSESYNSLKDIDKPNHIQCPICLMETNDNKILKCKHGICKTCYKELKKSGTYRCPYCRIQYGKPLTNPIITSAIALSFFLGGMNV